MLAPATEGFTPVIFWDTPLCHILSASFARFNSCPGTLSSGQLMFFLSYKFYLNKAVTKMRRNESIFAVIYSPSGAQSVYLIHQSPHCFFSVWSPIILTSLCWMNLMAICGHKCGILGAHQQHPYCFEIFTDAEYELPELRHLWITSYWSIPTNTCSDSVDLMPPYPEADHLVVRVNRHIRHISISVCTIDQLSVCLSV